MKICHVSFGKVNHTSPEEWLKTIPYFTSILTEMSKQNRVVSFHYTDVEKTASFNGVDYYFLRSDLWEKYFLNTLVQSVTAFSPDVIILHGWHSILQTFRFIGAMRGSRIYIQHHAEKCFRGPKAIVQRWLDKFISGYFFSSKALTNGWVQAGLIKSPSKIFEVLETTSSFPSQMQQKERSEKFSFIWVGRLDENKDPMTLIDGFKFFLKTNPQAQLYMIFKTEDLLPMVIKETRGFEKSFHLIGNLPHVQMQGWYEKSNFIISTSLFEGGGVAVLEGMACGCIPILSDIPAFQKMTDQGRVGFLIPVKSPEKLAAALSDASDIDLAMARKKMSEYFNENLSARAIARQILEHIHA